MSFHFRFQTNRMKHNNSNFMTINEENTLLEWIGLCCFTVVSPLILSFIKIWRKFQHWVLTVILNSGPPYNDEKLFKTCKKQYNFRAFYLKYLNLQSTSNTPKTERIRVKKLLLPSYVHPFQFHENRIKIQFFI